MHAFIKFSSIDMGWSTWLCSISLMHRSDNIFVLLRFSSLVALEAVTIITSSAAADGSFVAVTTFSFRCIAMDLFLCAFRYTNFTWLVYNLMNVSSSIILISLVWVLMYVITRDCPEPCGTVKWHHKNNRILCLNCGARSPSLAQPSGIVTS